MEMLLPLNWLKFVREGVICTTSFRVRKRK